MRLYKELDFVDEEYTEFGEVHITSDGLVDIKNPCQTP